MTSDTWFALVFLGIVALALVVSALLILLGGRTAPDPAHWDMPGQTGFDRTDARYWKLGFYMNPPASSCPSVIQSQAGPSISAIPRGGSSPPASCWGWPC